MIYKLAKHETSVTSPLMIPTRDMSELLTTLLIDNGNPDKAVHGAYNPKVTKGPSGENYNERGRLEIPPE